MSNLGSHTRWLLVGIGIKRWLLLLVMGIVLVAFSLSLGIQKMRELSNIINSHDEFLTWTTIIGGNLIGLGLIVISVAQLFRAITIPYREIRQLSIIEAIEVNRTKGKGIKVVAIGGGTGLPSILRGFKPLTKNIVAIVTVADDGGSSGRLRNDLGIIPPGDLRKNIVALANDEDLMTQLFQFRFDKGELAGHSFGNLFISALAEITGSIESALVKSGNILNIQGKVFPATLQNLDLVAKIKVQGTTDTIIVQGESAITNTGGTIEQLELNPPDVHGYEASVQAILDADLVVIGPGSLFTSVLPNIIIYDIKEALFKTDALVVYVCNIATQPGETEGYDVADHVLALEQHIGQGIFSAVIANNEFPLLSTSSNTHYVKPIPRGHEVYSRYIVHYTDIVDITTPWRHDPKKVASAIMSLHLRLTGVSRRKPNNLWDNTEFGS